MVAFVPCLLGHFGFSCIHSMVMYPPSGLSIASPGWVKRRYSIGPVRRRCYGAAVKILIDSKGRPTLDHLTGVKTLIYVHDLAAKSLLPEGREPEWGAERR